jgi:hypothetical protein
VVYEGPGLGQAVVALMSTWDTPADAKEFADAYTKRTALRYPGAAPGTVLIDLRGSRVLILEGLPATANKAALLRALWP